MSNHTPGPWFPVNNGFYWEVRTDSEQHCGEQIGDVCASKYWSLGTHQEGNARLIAAAPNMLAFAKQVADYAQEAECFYLMALAESVIKKAEGR